MATICDRCNVKLKLPIIKLKISNYGFDKSYELCEGCKDLFEITTHNFFKSISDKVEAPK